MSNFRIEKFFEYNQNKYTRLEAVQIVLKKNNNRPMTAEELYKEMVDKNLITTIMDPKNFINDLSSTLTYHSANTPYNWKGDHYGKKLKIFIIKEGRPRKFSLLDSTSDIISEEEVEELDNTDIPEIQIKRFTKNPFATVLCVVGESGAGKSFLIETLLEKEGHVYEFIIPTSSTTSLLSQFSPQKGIYKVSRLGSLLIESTKNPNKFYTAVLDEMHKTNVIEMINDELLQAISQERNRGERFISVDGEIAELYEKDLPDLMIPDNFGFVFITSKPRIIQSNPDLINRIRIVEVTDRDRGKINTIQELLDRSVLGNEYEPGV